MCFMTFFNAWLNLEFVVTLKIAELNAAENLLHWRNKTKPYAR